MVAYRRFGVSFTVLLVSIAFIQCDVIVNTSNGRIRGVQTSKSLQFLGIPYAAPPVGNLRWRSPLKPDVWSPNVLNATMHAPACPQKYCDKYLPAPSCPDVSQTSEDCLYMNIWTPLGAIKGSNYPVMVFLHGGAFKWGFGSDAVYDGNNLAKDGKVILVNVDYRLGLLGFLYTGESPEDSHGNLAIQDQRLALQWVQENIYNFGGDINKVTLFGQSAGAQSVAIHMTSAKSEGLFRNAIIESSPFALPYRDKNSALDLYNVIRKLLRCPKNDMACMRSKTVAEVNDAQQDSLLKLTSTKLVEYFEPIGPVIDGVDVIIDPMIAAVKGKYENIPTMTGTVTEEGRLFVYGAWKKNLTKTEYESALLVLRPFNFEEVKREYPIPKNTSDLRDELSQIATDFLFTCATRNVSRNIVKNHTVPVYRYVFDHAPSGRGARGIASFCEGHVCHASELRYIFQNKVGNSTSTPEEILLSESMLTYWTNFAYTSDPNMGPRSQNLKWLPYMNTPDNATLMYFATPNNDVKVNYRKEYCDFWDSIGYA